MQVPLYKRTTFMASYSTVTLTHPQPDSRDAVPNFRLPAEMVLVDPLKDKCLSRLSTMPRHHRFRCLIAFSNR